MNADADTTIQQYWGSEHDEYNHDEMFAVVFREWESKWKADDATQEFLRQVVTCRLEDELLMWLLQSHATDVVDDIEMLFIACSASNMIVNGLEVLEMVLDTILTAAIIRAAACDCNAVNRTKRIAEIVNMTKGGKFMASKARHVLRSLRECDAHDEDTELWMKFVELPNTLNTRLFNSRSDRAFVDEASQIITVQQAELNAVRRVNDGCADVKETGGQTLTSNKLWDLTKKLVELINTKADERDVQYNHCVDPDTIVRVNVVDNIMDLKSRLRAKGITGLRCSSSDPVLDDEDASLSAIELLSSFCTSQDGKEMISSDMLDKVFDELSAIKQLRVISIQASFLLGLQMRLKVCFLDRFESTKDEFERRVRRVFNCLTDKAHDMKHVTSLVILSAFCPRQVIRQFLLGARADVLHHNLYLEVLRASPLLLDWTKDAEAGSDETVLECDLQQAVLDVSSNQSNFDRESQNLISFLLSVVRNPISSFSKREAPVMTISNLLDKVINPVCYATDRNIQAHPYLYTLIQRSFQQFVAVNACRDINPTILECSFSLVLGALCSVNARDLRLGVLIRERLLLLLKVIMELMPDLTSVIMLEQLDTPLNPSLWTLLTIYNNDLVRDEFCKGLEDVALVQSFMQIKLTGDLQFVLPLPTVISAIQVLLWGLLWDATLSVKSKGKSIKAETWSLVDTIARYEFLESESAVETTAGALLIRSAIAEIMLECGSDLFQALFAKIIPYLLEYEPKTSAEDRLVQPKWAAVKLSKLPAIEQQIPCVFVSTHSIMRYVAKCWGLSAAVKIQLATQENALLLDSFSHVLAAHEPAITSSQGSLSGTLFCIQWLCFLASTARDVHLDKMPAWPTVRTQLELLLLRLLHQLEQLKAISMSEAKFSQYFVAAWLAYLPVGQFHQVFNFVASRART